MPGRIAVWERRTPGVRKHAVTRLGNVDTGYIVQRIENFPQYRVISHQPLFDQMVNFITVLALENLAGATQFLQFPYRAKAKLCKPLLNTLDRATSRDSAGSAQRALYVE